MLTATPAVYDEIKDFADLWDMTRQHEHNEAVITLSRDPDVYNAMSEYVGSKGGNVAAEETVVSIVETNLKSQPMRRVCDVLRVDKVAASRVSDGIAELLNRSEICCRFSSPVTRGRGILRVCTILEMGKHSVRRTRGCGMMLSVMPGSSR